MSKRSLYAPDSDGPKFYGVLALVLAALLLFAAMFWAGPRYRVYSQTLRGEAALREAESSRQIAVLEAKAILESAKFKSDAEIERARGVAEANRIIGDSLKGNDAYLRYLWIENLNSGQGERIYIPTEAGLPILEARPDRIDEER